MVQRLVGTHRHSKVWGPKMYDTQCRVLKKKIIYCMYPRPPVVPSEKVFGVGARRVQIPSEEVLGGVGVWLWSFQ